MVLAGRSFAWSAPPPLDHPWQVLIVDGGRDDLAHRPIRLGELRFDGRPVSLLECRSRAEAETILRREPDLAVAVLDDGAAATGPDLAGWIRKELGNARIRLILRTDRPFTRELATEIDDVAAASSPQRLAMAVTVALRAYRDRQTVERDLRALDAVLAIEAHLSAHTSPEAFAEAVLAETPRLIPHRSGALLCAPAGPGHRPVVLAASGSLSGIGGREIGRNVEENAEMILDALEQERTIRAGDRFAFPIGHPDRPAAVLYVAGVTGVPAPALLALFFGKIAVGLDTIRLWQRLNAAHRGVARALAHVAEYKDQVTGEHLRRIEAASQAIARRLAENVPAASPLIEFVGQASILHDVGKIGIPDDILNKPGRLTEAEQAVMRTHALIGERLLDEAARGTDAPFHLHLAARVAGGHHEKWDGSGYPRGLAGEAIPLAARIVAVADVYDALTSSRPYKTAWPIEDARKLIRNEAGRHFDPRVVDAFLALG